MKRDASDMFVTNKQLYDELTKVTDKITRLQVIVGAQVAVTSFTLFAKFGTPPVVPNVATALKTWVLTSTLSV
jgi:hypothetical protein